MGKTIYCCEDDIGNVLKEFSTKDEAIRYGNESYKCACVVQYEETENELINVDSWYCGC